VNSAEMLLSVKLLIEQRHYEQAAQILEVELTKFEAGDWLALLQILTQIPKTDQIASAKVAYIYARTLMMNDRHAELEEVLKSVTKIHNSSDVAPVRVEYAASLIDTKRYIEARQSLQDAIRHTSGQTLGLAWSRLGMTFFYLNEPWRDSYLKARQFLSGIELGQALFNEGYCLAQSHQSIEARDVWFEAIPHFRGNPKWVAWTRCNLGMSALRNLDPEAERHFLEADRLTRNPKASSLRAASLCGLAGSRRVFGEWSRAELTYREALHVSVDSHDRKESYLGLVRTLRLAGRLSEALETLEFALSDATLELNLFHVARAKVFLALNQNDHARQSLERVGPLVSTYDQSLERIARAELARRDGHLEQAVTLLEGLPVHTLHAREEVRQWPHLFQLIEAAGQPVPLPLEYVQGTTVRVAALGVLQVTVNDRGVPIVPTGRVGELLVFLLEHGGAASLEVISEALYPEATHERARKSVWMLVKFLRTALGWDGAVIALRAAYQLDPNVTWQYDVREVRTQGTVQGTVQGGVQTDFLAGVYSEWALEVGRELGKLTDSAASIIN
jgi:tetratricopeptide (TPR) repeat protein